MGKLAWRVKQGPMWGYRAHLLTCRSTNLSGLPFARLPGTCVDLPTKGQICPGAITTSCCCLGL